MNVVFVSFAWMKNKKDPTAWLKELDFYTGILTRMSKEATVTSIHSIDNLSEFEADNVHYIFHRQTWFDYLFPFKVIHILKRLRPAAIVVHGLGFPWHLLFVRLAIGKEVLFYVQHHAERPLRFPKSALQRWIDAMITAYFFTSIDLAIDWVTTGQISKLGKIHEVMEASSVFVPVDREAARQSTRIQGETTFLWVGRWDENKDPHTLLNAFERFCAEMSTARLYILGTEAPSDLRYHPGIVFCGRKNHHELVAWYSGADFIVSTSHYEGSGIAVCEGMSCGCIPIVTDIPSFRMMTGDGACGFLFPPGDEDALYECLLKAGRIDIPSERDKVLRQFREELSFEAIARKMMNVFREDAGVD